MRRALAESLPALTRFYGITPPDLERMTFREIDEYLSQMRQAQRDEEEAVRRGG